MPVKTRSQHKSELENDNIIINVNSDNTRQVIFTTPEKSQHNVSCVPTPCAPRAPNRKQQKDNISPTIVKRLDFDECPQKMYILNNQTSTFGSRQTKSVKERYPLNYKNFIIANKFQKTKVDSFLFMINEYKCSGNMPPFSTSFIQLSKILDEYKEIPSIELLNMAETLNSFSPFWKIFNKYQDNMDSLPECVSNWAFMLANILIVYLSRACNEANTTTNGYNSRKIISENIVPRLITFKQVFCDKKFPKFSKSRSFLGIILKKMLEFLNSGYILSAVVLFNYYPDMFTKECYPYVNTNDKIIYDECVEQISKSQAHEMISFYEHCKSIYNFK